MGQVVAICKLPHPLKNVLFSVVWQLEGSFINVGEYVFHKKKVGGYVAVGSIYHMPCHSFFFKIRNVNFMSSKNYKNFRSRGISDGQ